jgi:hypothetical protein
MDTDRLSDLIQRGRLTVSASRSSRANAAATRERSCQIRDELHVFVHTSAGQRPLLDQSAREALLSPDAAWLQDVGYYRLAENAIDRHGRWARHVVLQRAIDQLMAGDPIGEQVWRRVFNAILALQHRPRQSLPSGA